MVSTPFFEAVEELCKMVDKEMYCYMRDVYNAKEWFDAAYDLMKAYKDEYKDEYKNT